MAELEEPPAGPLPPVSVIVLVDASDPRLGEALQSLAAQDYPDYELVIATPHASLLPPGALPPRAKVALTGEPGALALLQAGVRAARHRSEVLAFAAAGGLVSRLWLKALVAPLSEKGGGVSTGFRWYAPDPPAFWPLMRSVWNAVMAGRLGPG